MPNSALRRRSVFNVGRDLLALPCHTGVYLAWRPHFQLHRLKLWRCALARFFVHFVNSIFVTMKSSGGTSCAKAIQLFEEKTGSSAAEAEEVRLICQLPPIEKMDNSLNTLTACRHLSLSTNCIEKMINLPNLKNLQILSLARNQIKRISGLEEVGQTLRELWLSYNQIERLDGLQPCVKLEVLYMSNNKIKGWEEVEKLAALPSIVNVLFKGNPFYETVDDVRSQMLRRLPKLATLDGETVTEDMREKALTAP